MTLDYLSALFHGQMLQDRPMIVKMVSMHCFQAPSSFCLMQLLLYVIVDAIKSLVAWTLLIKLYTRGQLLLLLASVQD